MHLFVGNASTQVRPKLQSESAKQKLPAAFPTQTFLEQSFVKQSLFSLHGIPGQAALGAGVGGDSRQVILVGPP